MDLTLAFVYQLTASHIIQEDQSCDMAASWKWIDQDKNNSKFHIANAMAYDYLATNGTDTARWNATWSRTDSEEIWKKRWAYLWSLDLSTREIIFIWRILAKGLFTGACAILMGHHDTNCKVCPSELETIPHLFETCCHVRHSWQAISKLYCHQGVYNLSSIRQLAHRYTGFLPCQDPSRVRQAACSLLGPLGIMAGAERTPIPRHTSNFLSPISIKTSGRWTLRNLCSYPAEQ
jgi:hypothetical protein